MDLLFIFLKKKPCELTENFKSSSIADFHLRTFHLDTPSSIMYYSCYLDEECYGA
jgi:hypothetical protein